MSDIDITEADKAKAKRELKEHYHEKTGEELPDHVIENLELLSGPSLVDIAEIEQRSRLAEKEFKKDRVSPPEVLFLLGELTVSGLVGLYASRFFAGWPAQVAGGSLIALLTFTIVGFTTWWLTDDE